MDSAFMESFAQAACALGIETTRFEFAYMAERRGCGKRRPPPRIDTLVPVFKAVTARWCAEAEGARDAVHLIGGKSMGGRIATHLATMPGDDSGDVDLSGPTRDTSPELRLPEQIDGVVCLGYPFHPQGKPDTLRTAHLPHLVRSTLIVQGERDPFGAKDEVAGYALGTRITLHWLTDGDHDFGPRGRSGATRRGNIGAAAAHVAAFADALAAAR
ncbi:MAG: alpha/beta family hydrolase [Pseudomonadota bacterium]